jgi:hypothetical protein
MKTRVSNLRILLLNNPDQTDLPLINPDRKASTGKIDLHSMGWKSGFLNLPFIIKS